jgi:glutamate-ammonia-ligase adenylyltransferase
MHLRVGLRDILGKDSIIDTHRALSDIAEVCLRKLIADEYQELTRAIGTPIKSSGEPMPYAVMALGKLGGQEPNYHSDLSMVVLFEQEGLIRPSRAASDPGMVSCRYFFEQLAQRVMKRCNRTGPRGRLYELDVRFGPLGKSGVLAMELPPFLHYFHSQPVSIIERISLCQARPIAGLGKFPEQAADQIAELIRSLSTSENDRRTLVEYRRQLQANATIHNLKRGEGGTMDVELLVQHLQLTHAHRFPTILVAGTLEAIRLLEKNGLLDIPTADQVHQGYLFLREVESGIRLMNSTARHDFPQERLDRDNLAFHLRQPSGEQLNESIQRIRVANRQAFDSVFAPSK